MGLLDLIKGGFSEKSTSKAASAKNAKLSVEYYNDKTYQSLNCQYYALSGDIEANYSILHNLGIKDGPRMEAIEKQCLDAMALLDMLIPMWTKYGIVAVLQKDYQLFGKLKEDMRMQRLLVNLQ